MRLPDHTLLILVGACAACSATSTVIDQGPDSRSDLDGVIEDSAAKQEAASERSPGLVLWYRMEEGADSVDFDIVDSGPLGLDARIVQVSNPGTILRDQPGPDGYGRAIKLEGWGQFIELPTAFKQHVSQRFTVAVWARTGGANESMMVGPYSYCNVNNEHIGWGLRVRGDGRAEAMANVGDAETTEPRHVASSTVVTDDKWHHLAATYDGKRLSVYVDGDRAGDEVFPTANLDAGEIAATIGATSCSYTFNVLSDYWQGSLDEFKLFNRALSGEEILAEMAP